MNEQMYSGQYLDLCQTLLAMRKSRDWDGDYETFDEYAKDRWGLSKSRAKLLCGFAKFRWMCEQELFGTLPETPEQVKELLALPQKQWLETWELILTVLTFPIRPQNVESAMQHFGIYAHKTLSPEAKKAIRVRRAAKTMAESGDGAAVVREIGGKALGKNWNRAVEFVIEADQERMNAYAEKG